MAALANRYDFVYLFDVTNGNPNGDPDAGNLPRVDPMTNCGLVSDVCLKRKVRNYVSLTRDGEDGFDIYVAERAVLNNQNAKAWRDVAPKSVHKKGGKDDQSKLPKKPDEARRLTKWMCDAFYDVRTFGAVMTTGVNCGQVRGPVQFAFARSIEPILPIEVTVTRMAVTSEKDAEAKGDNRTMGRKHIVPYGLYRAHGFVSACLADDAKGTGFSEEDAEVLWSALTQMFEHDRSAARGEMSARRLVLFKHESKLGNAPAHRLFDRVTVNRVFEGEEYDPDSRTTHNLPPARKFADYAVHVNTEELPSGVEVVERI